MVFLMIAVGWKCMFFVWDPVGIMQQRQLFVRSTSSNNYWMIDMRINHATGEINIRSAMTLDCFSEEQVNGQVVLKNWRNLGIIEQTLLSVQNMALQGFNPTHFL